MRAHPLRVPREALACGDTHAVEGRSDVLVAPLCGHVADDGVGLDGGALCVLARERLLHAVFGMVTTAPMDHKHHLTRLFIDVDDDLADQRAHEPLLRAHCGGRSVPCGFKIGREREQACAIRCRRRRRARGIETSIAIAKSCERRVPSRLELGRYEAVVRIDGLVPTLRELHFVLSLLTLKFQSALPLVVAMQSLLLCHDGRLDRHRLYDIEE